ncbi:MAG: helix-turn-helix transcriptional regulator [Clostridia bacterium]|nr:helix-turn-helix transcriptional regulator [Clostridia bacterium]
MPLAYKTDILAALKEKGYNTTLLRKNKLLAEGVIQSLREKKPISWTNISKVCELLECQPGDILEFLH